VLAKVIRNIAFFGMAGFSAIAVLFILGEWLAEPVGAASEPGILAPIMFGLVIIATVVWVWLHPSSARIFLFIAASAIAALCVWWGLAPQFWTNLMDENGPVIPVAAIMVSIPLVVWGWHTISSARSAGILLVIVASAPILGVAVSPPDVARGVLTAVAIMTGPYVIGGILYILASLNAKVSLT